MEGGDCPRSEASRTDVVEACGTTLQASLTNRTESHIAQFIAAFIFLRHFRYRVAVLEDSQSVQYSLGLPRLPAGLASTTRQLRQ